MERNRTWCGSWLVAMKERFGTKSFSELLAPAIYYAENGVPINEVTAEDWRKFEKSLGRTSLFQSNISGQLASEPRGSEKSGRTQI